MNTTAEAAYPTPYANSSLLVPLLLSLSLQKHSPDTTEVFENEYDYIVVGAGSAGAVVANRLSEDAHNSVLLLEAGKPPPMLSDIPAIARHFVNSDIDWKYFTTPQNNTAAGLIDRRVPWPSGKTLGGSSTINAMLYVRGNRRNYDEWETLGAKGWNYAAVLPYFKKLEDNTDPLYVLSGYHGVGGPITASRPDYNPVKKVKVIKALRNENYKFVNSNSKEQNGIFDHQGSIRRGQRCSTAKAYLVPAENRPNLDIVANAMVRKVLIENKAAIGVEFDFQNSRHQVRARREVILSAGTTNTAQLLMLSGIGPSSELQKFFIPVVEDLPVGHNLQDHPAALILYEVKDNIPKFEDEIRDNVNINKYISTKTGPLTATEGVELMSFLNNEGNGMKGIPDHTLYFADLVSLQYLQGGMNPEVVEKLLVPNSNKSLIACCSQLLHTKSIGSVSLQSADPYDPPLIDPNYFNDSRDLNDVVQGLKRCQKIMSNRALKRIGAKPVDTVVPGCEEFAQDVDLYLECMARTIIFTTNHQVGTAKMGDPEDPTTVVDPQLRVKGIRRLRVVDASVMPTIPWSNTNIPTIMVAEKASDIIRGRTPR